MLKKIKFDVKRGSNISQKSTESQAIDDARVNEALDINNPANFTETVTTNNRTSFVAKWFYSLFSLCCCCFLKNRMYQSSSTQMQPQKGSNKATSTRNIDLDSIGSCRTRLSTQDLDESHMQSFISEDSLTIPYTELLVRLRKVRQNLISLTMAAPVSPRQSRSHSLRVSVSTTHSGSSVGSIRPSDSATYNVLTNETIADLDWCLEQLELMQEHRISDNMSRINLPLDLRRMFGTHNEAQQPPEPRSGIFIPKRISAYGVETPHETELGQILARVDTWTMDIFLVDEWSLHRPLTCVMYTLFLRRHLLPLLEIPATTFLNFATALEDKYVKANPFHNSVHAADVTQATHYFLNLPSLRPTFSQLEICCAIFAAAVHDVDHPGLTNQYLVNSCSELAIMYNDTSVLENHHLAVAFHLLQNKNRDIFRNIEGKKRQALRRLIIGMVLSTDMTRHFKLLSKLRVVIAHKPIPPAELRFDSYIDRLVVLENIVHCADLSNPARPLALYKRWTNLLMEEFYRQGDRERDAGLEISHMCDRFRARIERWQVSFIDTFVYPEFEAFAELVKPELKEVIEQLKKNRTYYVESLPPEARPSVDLSIYEPPASGSSMW